MMRAALIWGSGFDKFGHFLKNPFCPSEFLILENISKLFHILNELTFFMSCPEPVTLFFIYPLLSKLEFFFFFFLNAFAINVTGLVL